MISLFLLRQKWDLGFSFFIIADEKLNKQDGFYAVLAYIDDIHFPGCFVTSFFDLCFCMSMYVKSSYI